MEKQKGREEREDQPLLPLAGGMMTLLMQQRVCENPGVSAFQCNGNSEPAPSHFSQTKQTWLLLAKEVTRNFPLQVWTTPYFSQLKKKKYRDPQSEIPWKVSGTFSLKCNVSITSLPQSTGNPHIRKGRETVRTRGEEDTQKGPLNPQEQSS